MQASVGGRKKSEFAYAKNTNREASSEGGQMYHHHIVDLERLRVKNTIDRMLTKVVVLLSTVFAVLLAMIMVIVMTAQQHGDALTYL